MNQAPKNHADLSILKLSFKVFDDRPDWPALTIRVDGRDPFAAVAKDWQGFDPGEMLGDDSPLIPDDLGRRVAVHQCSCGIAGCGVIAPFISASPDRKRISWVDFRDYVGVFNGPTAPSAENHEGKLWNLPDLHFNRDQYLAEVARASSDRSWETPRRQTARLLHDRLSPMQLVLPPHLRLRWVSPAWAEEGLTLMFERRTWGEPGEQTGTGQFQQQMLCLTSAHKNAARAAADMADQLLSVAPVDWFATFGRPLR